jgi:hypothetical protein
MGTPGVARLLSVIVTLAASAGCQGHVRPAAEQPAATTRLAGPPVGQPPVENAAEAPGVPPGCERDQDCVLTAFDCSACGRCPDSPPYALTPAQLAAAEADCRRNPPARLDPDGRKSGRAFPACSPCPGPTVAHRPAWKPVCRGHQCVAEIEPTQAIAPSQLQGQPATGLATCPISEVGGLRLGATLKAVRAKLGKEEQHISAKEEAESWSEIGYRPERSAIFHTGFDTILVFNNDAPKMDFPFWKVFLRAGRVVGIKLSSFGYDRVPSIRKVGWPPSCFMLGEPNGVVATFGSGAVVEPDPAHRQTNYTYLDLGVEIIVVDERIRVMTIFEPLAQSEAVAFKRELESKLPAPAEAGE